jgi:hypothetical protein
MLQVGVLNFQRCKYSYEQKLFTKEDVEQEIKLENLRPDIFNFLL